LKKHDRPRGLLDPREGQTRFVESIRSPAPDLEEIVKQYWSACWDLRKRTPYVVQVLPPPCVNLVVSGDGAWIQGLVRGRYCYTLRDSGRLFGVSFQPAGFRGFLDTSVARLVERAIEVQAAFGVAGDRMVEAVRRLDDDVARVELVEAFLRTRLPRPDANVRLLNGLVEQITTDRSITRVDQVAHASGISVRNLQRLFREFIGISPKWVIQRCRLQEAAASLDSDNPTDLAWLALELGYADQAHLARDFKAIVGRTPSEYARGGRPEVG
jgi:AraC-like DNA-binding protein